MSKYVYPAVFTHEPEGGFSISFPDVPHCYTQGEDIKDGFEMAADVLALTLYGMERDGKSTPAASNVKSLSVDENSFATLVMCDTDAYKKMHNNKAVKKTLSIPEWLNEEAMERGINFSQTLQDALVEKLEQQ